MIQKNMWNWKEKLTPEQQFYAKVALAVLAGAFFSFFISQELSRQKFLKAKKTIQESELALQDERAALKNIQNRLDTINEFLNRANVKTAIQDNEKYRIKISEMERNLSIVRQTFQDNLKQKEHWQKLYQDSKEQWESDLKKNQEALENHKQVLEENLQKELKHHKAYRSSLIFKIEKTRYMAQEKDLTALVYRMKFVEFLAEVFPGVMVEKKASYARIWHDLQTLSRQDDILKDLKPVKIYTRSPLLASLKDKYTSAEKDLTRYVSKSNEDIILQMSFLIQHFDDHYKEPV